MQLPNVKNLNIDLVRSFRRFRVDPEYVCPSRESNGLIYYIRGSQIFEYGDSILEAREGDVLYLPYGSVYRNRVYDPKTEYYEIDFNLYQNGEPVPLYDLPQLIAQPESLQYKPLIYQIIHDNLSLDDSRFYAGFANLCLCIDMLVAQKNRENNAMLERILPSVEYINANYQQSTSIEEIAAMSSTCITNLERLFKQCFHVTPSMYRNIVRINKAKQLLLAGCSIDETAAEVGFYDSFHFSKTFKRLTGTSPGAYARTGH